MRSHPHPSFFLEYQRKWVTDPARLKIMEKSRQIGISWATAYSLVRRQSQGGTRLDAWVSSRDETQARLFLEDCAQFAKILNLASGELGVELLSTSDKPTIQTLTFAHGPRIHSMSSNPDAQAGKRGSRVLDEFALHPAPRQLYAIAYPGITWGGQLEIVSTHRGTDNFFNTLVQEARHGGNPKNISLHRVTLEDALNCGFLECLQAKLPEGDARHSMDRADYFNFIRSSCADEESFQQEYMCNPSDDSTAFIPYDLIGAAQYAPEESWEVFLDEPGLERRELFLGVDVGRDHDLTVMWLLERVGGVLLTRKILTFAKATFSEQEEALWGLLAHPAVKRAAIDQTGLGRQLAEQARERFGAYRVEGITFTESSKEALAYPVRCALEDRRLKIPEDKAICADLRAIKKEITAAGHLRFSADRGKNGHADRFWALALAVNAAYIAKSSQPLHCESLPRIFRNLF
ncbi:MAG: hypothetical protein B7X06_00060 [Verrucomicrobia bacterium 21-51-4]|nr:MAG: hypothetical protein B7X06_00060 [Verrucomicrobia bacterium 21-51-4]HQU08360.1 terminase family protein [Opitutales bacterium]